MAKHKCLSCEVVIDFEPVYCCSGRECGCKGLPIDPPLCGDCERELFKMAKINREEYEVLKELDDEWKWITRDMNSKTGEIGGVRVFKEKPSRMKHYHFNVGGVINENWKYLDRTLFNFIDWDISEPYSIDELIEELEEEE